MLCDRTLQIGPGRASCSNQRYQAALCISVATDVALRGVDGAVTGQSWTSRNEPPARFTSLAARVIAYTLRACVRARRGKEAMLPAPTVR